MSGGGRLERAEKLGHAHQRTEKQMDVIGHDDPRVHLVMPNLGAVFDRSPNQLSNSRLAEEGRAALGLIEQAVHGDEGFPGGQIRGWKRALWRKTVP